MSPGSDTDARLIEADALLAAGDPRGELIVIQCELAMGGLDRARSLALRKREEQLLWLHGDEWADLEGLATEAVFHRGYVEEAKIDVRTFASREKELWKRAPHLRRLRVHGLRYRSRSRPDATVAREVCYWIDRLLASGRVRNFEAIDPIIEFSNDGLPYRDGETCVSDAVVDWILKNKAIEQLTGLTLPSVAPETLFKINHCHALEDLRLEVVVGSTSPFKESDVGQLRPRRLAITHAHGQGFTGAIPGLLGTSIMTNVVDLEVPFISHALKFAEGVKILRGVAGDLAFIADAPQLSGLEELEIRGAANHDYTPLHDPRYLGSLRVLRTFGSPSPKEIRDLCASPLGRRLEVIELVGAPRETIDLLRASDWDGVVLGGPLTEPCDRGRHVV